MDLRLISRLIIRWTRKNVRPWKIYLVRKRKKFKNWKWMWLVLRIRIGKFRRNFSYCMLNFRILLRIWIKARKPLFSINVWKIPCRTLLNKERIKEKIFWIRFRNCKFRWIVKSKSSRNINSCLRTNKRNH